VFERWPHSDEMVGDAYRDRGRSLGFGVMTSLQPKHAKDIRTKWDEVIKELDNAKSVDQMKNVIETMEKKAQNQDAELRYATARIQALERELRGSGSKGLAA